MPTICLQKNKQKTFVPLDHMMNKSDHFKQTNRSCLLCDTQAVLNLESLMVPKFDSLSQRIGLYLPWFPKQTPFRNTVPEVLEK